MVSEVSELISRAIQNSTPFSLVRIGDGEGDVILKANRSIKRLTGWTGVKFTQAQANGIADQIITAATNADVLGIPDADMLRKQPQYKDAWIRARKTIIDNKYHTGLLTSAYIHYDLDYSFVRGHKVKYIGSADIQEKLLELGATEVDWFKIATDYKRSNKKTHTKNHYPDQFNEIKGWIDNSITLIAAGGLGKIYCDWVKQAGGIAIDIGSMADSWGNNDSRAYFKKISHPGNFGGWAIEKPLYDWITTHFPKGAKIVELGSGTGTIELTKLYNVWSIEHDPKYIGVAPTNYVYAPIADNWYDPEKIKGNLPEEVDLMLVDGPPATYGRAGVLDNLDLFDTDATIVCDDINRPKDKKVFDALVKKLGRKSEVLKFNKHIGIIYGREPKGGALIPVRINDTLKQPSQKGVVVEISNKEEAEAVYWLGKTCPYEIALFYSNDAISHLDARSGTLFTHVINGKLDKEFFPESIVLSPYTVFNKQVRNDRIYNKGNKMKHQVLTTCGIISYSDKYSRGIYRTALNKWKG